jgi:hypothetical protein
MEIEDLIGAGLVLLMGLLFLGALALTIKLMCAVFMYFWAIL